MASITALAFTQTSHPNRPFEHLRLQESKLPPEDELAPRSIIVKILAAPVNPQDILVLTGRYPITPYYDLKEGGSIPGFDGVAKVLVCGSQISETEFKPGDYVIPKRRGLGTWRSGAIWEVGDVYKVSNQLDLDAAATMRMSALPAYLLLEDMRRLKPGDWVIQNAGGSAIGQYVVQLASLRGVNTISVIRDDSRSEKTKAALKKLGAALVFTESELDAETETTGKCITLALDCVFGPSGENIASKLSHGGQYVNYGSLGGQTFNLTQHAIFWKQIQFRSFRLSEQIALRSELEQEALVHWLEGLFLKGLLVPPRLEILRWDEDIERTLERAMSQSAVGRHKRLIVFH